MKTPRNLGLVAIVVLVISHFLPAFGNMSGFACFGYCWDTLLAPYTESHGGEWFYYSGFVISNILFIVKIGYYVLPEPSGPFAVEDLKKICIAPAHFRLVRL